MRRVFLGVLIIAAAAWAAEAAVVAYDAGRLDFTVKGSGTATVVAQADYKYYSEATGAEALARAVTPPMKIKLTGGETPVTVNFTPPGGQVYEVEILITVDGEEKARETFNF